MKRFLLALLLILCASGAQAQFLAYEQNCGARTLPKARGGLVINDCDGTLIGRRPNGTAIIGTLLNALPSGRKAVEQGVADDLTSTPSATAPNGTLARLFYTALNIPGVPGPQGPSGGQGPAGPQGLQGATGPQGAGVAIKGQVSSPANLPTSGNTLADAYIVTSSGTGYNANDVYTYVGGGQSSGPGGNWLNVGQIRGPAGTNGAQGATGPTGATGAVGPQGTPTTVNGKSGSSVVLNAGDVGALPITGGTTSGDIYAGGQGGSNGFAVLHGGDAYGGGYTGYFDKNGNRQAYIGYGDGNIIALQAEIGYFRFNKTPYVNNDPVMLGPKIVANNAALALAPAAVSPVIRQGFATAGDGGAATYIYSSTSCSISGGDGGSQVPASGGGCWLLDPSIVLTPQMFGVSCADVDSTAQWQRMVNAAIALGRAMRPTGDCKVKLTSTITVAGRLDLVAPGAQITNGGNTAAADPQTPGPGFWFHLAHTGVGHKFQPVNGVSLQWQNESNRVWGVGTYRDQPTPGTGAYTPCACDYDWAFYNTQVDIDAVTLNASQHVYVSKGGRNRYRLKGQPLTTGLYVESSYDTDTVEDIHYWPFWTYNSGVLNYMNASARSMWFKRADNIVVKKAFSFNYGICVDIDQYTGGSDGSYPGGSVANGQFGEVDCDQDAQTFVVRGGTQGVNIHIDSLVGFSSGLNYTGATTSNLVVFGTNNTVTIDDASLAFAGQYLGYVGGSGNRVHIGTAYVGSWNTGTTSQTPTLFPAFYATDGNLISLGQYNFHSTGAVMSLPVLGLNAWLSQVSMRPLSAQPTIDGGAGKVSVANGSTFSIPPGSGQLVLRDSAYGNICSFLYGNVSTVLTGSLGNCAATPTSGKLSLSWNGSAYVVTNNLGSTTTVFGVNSRAAPFN